MENDITIIFVSFHSDDIIEKSIATINHNVPIIVIENSRNFTLKEKLEKKYLNVKVIVPEKNLGNGAGINYGIKNIKTKYVFYLDVDTELYPDTIKNLMEAATKVKNFSILAPKINNFEYKSECYLDTNKNENYTLMRFVTGCALFCERKLFKPSG